MGICGLNVPYILSCAVAGFSTLDNVPLSRSCLLRVPGAVQHGVWTHLHAFWIIRESIRVYSDGESVLSCTGMNPLPEVADFCYFGIIPMR